MAEAFAKQWVAARLNTTVDKLPSLGWKISSTALTNELEATGENEVR
eukprot:CAMPEP_0113694708 /NCGR_PEP_ID=MMETSP0038_2-20120614/20460_1 /TAXON_ID=2898 /ORGANISM="Cryptomonas paramecium" /LENGTH=46 /DNA_ID=CAMNT_0000617101 /DNA_START=51 /DNA_END=191 /DNA_ORIENTATION=- /assembly_acc=CAM_ASM_000170